MFNTIKVNNTDTNYTHSIFDISDYNSGATYVDLSAALAAIPQDKKCGGMSVKFIQTISQARYSVVKTEGLETEPSGTLLSEVPYINSGTYDESQLIPVFSTLPSSTGAGNALTYYVVVTVDETTTYTTWIVTKVSNSDNKYVQYRLMSDTFNTTVANWQGVDDEPTDGSENLVKSGGVEKKISENYVRQKYAGGTDLDLSDDKGNVIARFKDGGIKTKNFDSSNINAQSIDDNVVSTAKIQDGAITNAKIQDGAIEDEKLKESHSIVKSGPDDFSIVDDSDNTILRLKNGEIETKNFNSKEVTLEKYGIVENNANADLDIEDTDGNKILRIKDGHIETKNFDSSNIAINDATQSTHGLMSAADKTKLDGLSDTIATTSKKGLMSAADKYKVDNIENSWQSYNEATTSVAGLMSASDKQKLDNITLPLPTPTIEGSGVYKNASAFGFLPTNDGATNSNALQTAVTGGGTIVVDIPGTYDIAYTCKLPSNTTLIFGANVTLSRVKDSENKYGAYVFINDGMYSNFSHNENITIIGLNLLTNGIGVDPLHPEYMYDLITRGTYQLYKYQLIFRNISHIKLQNCRIYNPTVNPGSADMSFTLGFQEYNDVLCEDIDITSPHDGFGFSCGENAVLRHIKLCTNDDCIGFHGVGYPESTFVVGSCKGILVEDVTIYVDEHHSSAIRLNVGAWTDWQSGKQYSQWGDICVSNGRIYRTMNGPRPDMGGQFRMITSTEQPTHTSGEVTYADGLTWLMMQDTNVVYSVTVSDAVFRNIRYVRKDNTILSVQRIWLTTDHNAYSYQMHEDADIPTCENILIDNMWGDNIHIFDANTPFRNVKIVNCVWKQPVNAYLDSEGDWFNQAHSESSDVFVTGCTFNDSTISNQIIRSSSAGSITALAKNNYIIDNRTLTKSGGDNIVLITD